MLEIKSSNAAPFLFPMKYLAVITMLILLSVQSAAAQVTPSPPVHCWPMDRLSGGLWVDVAGSNDFSGGGSEMAGVIDGAAYLDGNVYFSTELATTAPVGTESFTWLMWIAPENPSKSIETFLSHTAYQIGVSGNTIKYDFRNTGVQLSYPSNDWVFVSITHNSNSDGGVLYVDDSVPALTFDSYDGSQSTVRLIGMAMGGGAVDEVAFFDYALSSTTLTDIYNGGKGTSCAELLYIPPPPTPTPLPTPTPSASVEIVPLPSGNNGAIINTVTTGDIGIMTMLAILTTLLIYWIIRDHVKAVGVRNDANK